ncbi:sporulation-delaying protein SdpB family protein [Kitasatospora sp. LaBMicrA B282]|uniref:sporulation-delaying protein SdpB family protein n=1 Tax=Kitasatospora sp. LaBMicrA B282 TaxID=3420949 RepID=UPI003D0F6121
MRALTARVEVRVASFEPRSLPLAVARSGLALSQLITLVFTPDHALFFSDSATPTGIRCSGLHDISLWCLAGSSAGGMHLSRLGTILVLVAALSGYRPRWTCIPQWYVTTSMAIAMPMPEGGNNIAAIVTMLLIPPSLGDFREWQWGRLDPPISPSWRGSAYAALLIIRMQIALIYVDAALSKLAVPQWRDGSAMYTVFVDPNAGLPAGLRDLAAPLLVSRVVIASITWGTIALELGIALCALPGIRLRRIGFFLACVLHLGIMVSMGLISFAVTMISTTLVLWVDGMGPWPPRLRARN